MHDMGCQLKETKPASYSEFCCHYLAMMESTLLIQHKLGLVHGDIHEGNLLYREAVLDGECKLCLIDWDEASNKPTKRTVVKRQQKERYPKDLIIWPDAYTKTQLYILFRDVSKRHYGKIVYRGGDKKLYVRDVSDNEPWNVVEHTQALKVTSEDAEELYASLETFLEEELHEEEKNSAYSP